MKKLHGNNAKISVDKRVFDKSTSPAITDYNKKNRRGAVLPILSDTDVEIAKEFVDENHK